MKNKKKLSPVIQFALTVLLIALVYVIIQLMMNAKIINRYYSGILISICINVILVVSLNITTGFLGQLTLGHAGFMAIGAYVAAFLTKEVFSIAGAIDFILATLIAGVVAMVFGVIICLPTLRLKGDYLAIITLACGEVIKNILLNLDITGGASGYIGIPRYTNFAFAYIFAIITVYATYALIKSRFGRVVMAVRDNEIAAESSGVNINRVKMLAFVFAAFFAGVAGSLYAHYIGILEPKIFDFDKSIEILVMVVLGGMGSIKGSVIAAVVLTVLPEMLRGADNLRMLIYALSLIIIMLFKYSPTLSSFINRFRRKEKVS